MAIFRYCVSFSELVVTLMPSCTGVVQAGRRRPTPETSTIQRRQAPTDEMPSIEQLCASGRIRIRGAGVRTNIGDDLCGKRLNEERIVVAHVTAIAECDDGHPVRLLLLEKGD